MVKLIIIEENWKHSPYEIIDIISLKNNFDENKLFKLLERKINESKYTFVDTGNPYNFDKTSFNKVLKGLNNLKTSEPGYLTLYDFVDHYDNEDYLFPANFRITLVSINKFTL